MFDLNDVTTYSDNMKVPFIGRDNELNNCTKLLQNKIPRCRVITIEGAPGLGKTAFLHKIQQIAEKEDYEIYSGIINEGQETLSLQVWMQILEKCRLKYIQSHEGALEENQQEKYLFSALYGSWENITSFQEIGTENKKHLLFSWIGSFLAKFSCDRNIFISIDNFHLCNKSSINLLSYLLSLLDEYPIVFVLTFRPWEIEKNQDLQDLDEELQFHPHWESVYLNNLPEETIRNEYYNLKRIQADLPDETTIYKITEGNPLRLSAFLQINPGTQMNQKPLTQLWKQYKKRISPEALLFTEYISLVGNYFTKEEAGIICKYLGHTEYLTILDECLYISLISEQGEGFSFFHDDFRIIIEENIPLKERQSRILNIITLLEHENSLKKDNSILRLAGLYRNAEEGIPLKKRIDCYLLAADIMENWNAWDEAIKYLEELQALSRTAKDYNLHDEVECRLARCYTENLDMEKGFLLLPPLVDRLIENNNIEKLHQLRQITPFLWNPFNSLFTRIMEKLVEVTPADDIRRNSLLIMQAGLRLNDVNRILKDKENLFTLEKRILNTRNEDDKYSYFTILGLYYLTLKDFDKASNCLLKAESLPVSRFRLFHLLPLLKIALFTGFIQNRETVLGNVQSILKITQNKVTKNTYEGMLQRRYLYDGEWENIFNVGREDNHNRINYYTLPKFLANIWTGKMKEVKELIDYIITLAREDQKESQSAGSFQGLFWYLSIYSMIYDEDRNLNIIQKGVEDLLSGKYTPSGFRQQALISAARICRWAYSEDECRAYYDELVSYDSYFLEEEIHSIEIAKALLAERLGDAKAQEAHYRSALEWCKDVDEWPWRCWIYTRLSILFAKTDKIQSEQNRNHALTSARKINNIHVLTMLGEKPVNKPAHTGNVSNRYKLLSPRETEVLKLLAKGYTDKEIGKYLFISEHTVANHLRKVYHKIGASNRVEASRIAILEGIINES